MRRSLRRCYRCHNLRPMRQTGPWGFAETVDFRRLDARLTAKAAWQTVSTGHHAQTLGPGGAPVARDMR